MSNDYIYNVMVEKILEANSFKDDRTNTGTLSIVGHMARYHLQSFVRKEDDAFLLKDFPLLTTKEVNWKNIVTELLWFINGQTNIRFLEQNGSHIWCDWPLKYYNQQNPNAQLDRKAFSKRIVEDEEFAAKWGELGPVYGKQWRSTPKYKFTDIEGKEVPESEWDRQADGDVIAGADVWRTNVDQFRDAIELVKNNPNSRRIIVDSWNVADIEEMAKSGLPPCHTVYQFIVKDGKVNLLLFQRSLDVMLGAPYNIATYSLLIGLVAEYAGLQAGEFIHMIGDCHIYSNHIDAMKTQLAREPKDPPNVFIKAGTLAALMEETIANPDLDYSKYEDCFVLEDYDPHPAIRVPVAV